MESTRVNMCDFAMWSDFFLSESKTLWLSNADSKHEEDTGQNVRIDRLIRVCADYVQSAHCLLRVWNVNKEVSGGKAFVRRLVIVIN